MSLLRSQKFQYLAAPNLKALIFIKTDFCLADHHHHQRRVVSSNRTIAQVICVQCGLRAKAATDRAALAEADSDTPTDGSV
jgi:hypothetical protein